MGYVLEGRMKRISKIFLTPLIASSLLVSCSEEAPKQETKPRLVRAIKIGDAVLSSVWVPGTARATRELELSFRVGGRMIERPVFVGDELKQGDLVARIDPVDYELELRNAEGQLDNANANLTAAEADLQRVLNIQEKEPGAVARTTVDRAREERDQARANIKSLEAAVANAKVRLERTELRAPFDGTVVARYAEAFEDVKPNQPIVRMVDTSRIEFVVNLPESDISLLPNLTNIRVRFDAFTDRELSAEIKEVGTEASLTTRTFPVVLIMDHPEDVKILPGMSGQATSDLTSELDTGHIVVPVAATFTEERGSEAALEGRVDTKQTADRPNYVWVINEGNMTVERREVKIGPLRAAGVTVEEGLEVGEWIVTAGAAYLDPGQKIRISESTRE